MVKSPNDLLDDIYIYAFAYLAIYEATNFLADNFSADYFIDWAFAYLSLDDKSTTPLSWFAIPPLGLDTIFGTGLVSLAHGENPSGHDSGFIQAYYSLGLIFAIILYLSYILVLYLLVSRLPRLMAFAIIISFFLIETKRPFLFKYSTMFFLVAAFCSRGLQNNKKAISCQ